MFKKEKNSIAINFQLFFNAVFQPNSLVFVLFLEHIVMRYSIHASLVIFPQFIKDKNSWICSGRGQL